MVSAVLFPPMQVNCAHAERELVALLRQHGFQVQRAFDLDRSRAPDPRVRCPHHGTTRCTCRLSTYLVYTANGLLLGVLVLQGHDRRTRLRWNPTTPQAAAVETLMRAWARAYTRT